MPPISNDTRDQILMLLGEMKEGLKGVKEDIAEMKAAADEGARDASESRRRLYEKMESGEQRTTELESTVRIMAGVVEKQTVRIDLMEPQLRQTTATLRAWTVRGGMIATAMAALGGFIVWMVQQNGMALWRALVHLLQGTTS